jgi:hypothetical protein
MLKIGMDKTDKNFRKFEYDDERMYGNPKMFKVLYEETGIFGEVLCSNVISVRKSTNTHNHFLDIPVYNENKQEVDVKPVSNLVVNETQIVESTVEKKKTKSSTKSKAKTKDAPLTGKTIEVKEPVIEITSVSPASYEYDVLVVDNISYTEDIKYKLNEFGKDGWDVCGFQIVQKLFGGGCQAILIMKKGLN